MQLKGHSLIRIKIKTVFALGWLNIGKVVLYRMKKKWGYYKNHSAQLISTGSCFKPVEVALFSPELEANPNWQGKVKYFDHMLLTLDENPPDWHSNPFNGQRFDSSIGWWKIADFDNKKGDIKCFWQASRFDWVISFAQAAKQGDGEALNKLNYWLQDWIQKNPPYLGVNWKCGQEASIRVLHLAMAALILNQARTPSEILLELIDCHLKRIELTLSYAIAQDNNHTTSEAAALFIGGVWLESQKKAAGKKWHQLGRRKLERAVKRLIEPDGTFSQYSLNYHRVLVDTLNMVEVWRSYWKLEEFSPLWKTRVIAAIDFLFMLVDPKTGQVPNLGSNDGARLLPLTNTDYQDYRPSVQLANLLFKGQGAYEEKGKWDLALKWLNIPSGRFDPKSLSSKTKTTLFDDGGYAVIHRPKVMLLMRYPRFQFRPGHADALHLDLWIDGENHLRDGGTYSYNTNLDDLKYFSGTSSHNTIEFDGRDQMPRLGRFLFGGWLQTRALEQLVETEEVTRFGASYQDSYGAIHSRKIELSNTSLKVHDEIKGFVSRAVLRWRLKPGPWQIKDHSIYLRHQQIHIQASVPIIRFALVEGKESRFYLHKNSLPVLEIEVSQPGRLTTEYSWSL